MMQNLTCFSIILSLLIISCQVKVPKFHTLKEIETAFNNNELRMAAQWADFMLKNDKPDSITSAKLAALIDMAGRIKADFVLSETDINTRLQKEPGDYSPDQKAFWESNNWLEYKIIDGEKLYFKRAVPNLKLILKSHLSTGLPPRKLINDKFLSFRLAHSQKVIKASTSNGKPVMPVNMMVTYRLIVKPDAVPEGEYVRCWMPWPRESHDRLTNVKLLNSVPDKYLIADSNVQQRSIYMEQTATKGKPVIFEIKFSYQSMAKYFNLKDMKISAYDTTSPIFKKYTSEQPPQILFTNEIKDLSDSIVSGLTNPYEKVRKLYYWINDQIIWTGALEYSIIPSIPGYVLKNRRGDCGMQTMLLMSMARYQKIPVKWQSGWMMHPGEVNLHDWCEVYYEGLGWVPLDMSFNLQNSDVLQEKDFYISGIDAYRLIINDAIGGQFSPAKKFPRSEPYDFQRGEVEWRGGNLYFNQWEYQINVEYQ